MLVRLGCVPCLAICLTAATSVRGRRDWQAKHLDSLARGNYIVPEVVQPPEVILAVNVGGAIIPTIPSIYLLSKNGLWGRGLIATLCIAAMCHGLAVPVRGVGIGLPIFVPPLAAAFVAAIISWRHAAPLAYAGGSLGVLIGADLLNLDKLRGLGTRSR